MLSPVTIRHLQLDRNAFSPRYAAREGVTFSRVDPPLAELNRFLYTTIGGEWFWVDRRNWSAAQWAVHVSRDELSTWVLAVDGVPAGYIELEQRADGAVELAYVGLLPAFVGQGLGAHLVTCGIESALALGAREVLVETCNLDHPSALANYVARGFREIGIEVKQKELPAIAPLAWDGVEHADGARALLRHTVAVVAYRGGKSLRDAPASFAHFKVADGSREPIKILAHVGDLYDWALSMAVGKQKWTDTTPSTWDEEVARFFSALRAFDDYLATNAPLHTSAERLFAGPIADSLTHIGQVAMLRRIGGAPIKGENYSQAEIEIGRLGNEQSAPQKEFD